METKPQVHRQTIIGKNELVIIAKGQKEMATQLFNFNNIREIRVSIESLEVKLLMDYDESYHRVFITKPASDSEEDMKKAQSIILKFYNDLLNASMRMTKEDLEKMQKQMKSQMDASKNIEVNIDSKSKKSNTKSKK